MSGLRNLEMSGRAYSAPSVLRHPDDKELERLEIVRRTLDRRLNQAEAAAVLGLGERQVQRPCRA